MRALFPPWSNTAFRVALASVPSSLVLMIALLWIYVRSPLHTGQGHQEAQPIDFDHRHHVADDGIDCRYCHATVESSPSAGIPSTALCLNCHSQVWNGSPILAPLRQSYFLDRPIRWNRVHRLPDYVYFDHSIHVGKGVGCETCHGRVDQMAAIGQGMPLTMQWCLDCHRDPAPHLRPREAITQMGWRPPDSAVGRGFGEQLAQRYHVQTRTSCTACHR
ncbi:MAG: cytochrome c3 family protein [Myxococcales bacterium]